MHLRVFEKSCHNFDFFDEKFGCIEISVYLCSVFYDYPLSMRGSYEPYRHAPLSCLRTAFFIIVL